MPVKTTDLAAAQDKMEDHVLAALAATSITKELEELQAAWYWNQILNVIKWKQPIGPLTAPTLKSSRGLGREDE
jgi:hypothetical protein